MCGIAGILALNEEGKQHLSKINAATQTLVQRGPDGEGFYCQGNVALGHRRLSIIDTSNAGSQPFTDLSGRYTIIFNGEIFNYQQLRQELTSLGVQFKSESDTEVLLYLYINEKEKCLNRLDGEYAFSIYDKEKEELFLARDRFGIKPLYYFKDDNRFVFASELKALMKFDIPKVIDKASLQTYLHLNYIPSPYSIFENVHKLEAGTYLFIDSKNKERRATYYSISGNITCYSKSYDLAQKKLKQLLEESVINRMVSDVPLGTFLSGGIDSSIITAIAAQHTQHLNTFSIGYKDEPMFDETKYAQLVAKKYKTNHTVFELSNQDLFENLHGVLDYTDEPFADSSALAVNILSKFTKQHVTVALSGDGADELFGGYNKHAAELKVRNKGAIANATKLLKPLLGILPQSRNSKTGNTIRQLNKFAEGMQMNDKERYWRWAGFTDAKTLEKILLTNSKAEYEKRKADILKTIDEKYDSTLLTDMRLVLENDMLVKVDRMSMSRSLEIRVPFLDQQVVDFAFSLPTNYKIDSKQRKKVLKDAFRTFLPEELYNRGKQGFEVPLLNWFQTDLKSLINDDLLGEQFIKEQNIFNYTEISSLKLQLFSKNSGDAVARIWALVVFQYWWKKHFN